MEKHFTKSKTIRFNAALGASPWLIAVLLWLQGVLTGEGFLEVLLAFLQALGMEPVAAFVGSLLMVAIAAVGIVLRWLTKEPIGG